MPEYPPLWIPGHPRPKGSWTPGRNKKTGKIFFRHASGNTAVWCKHAKEVVTKKWRGPLIAGPVGLRFKFFLPKLKTVIRPYPTGAKEGDQDKLIRAIYDAMTGVVYVDDCQVVDSTESKRYTDGEPGVEVIVYDDY